MHTIELKLDDNIYENVMFLLNNLNLKGMEIEEKTDNKIDSLDLKIGNIPKKSKIILRKTFVVSKKVVLKKYDMF